MSHNAQDSYVPILEDGSAGVQARPYSPPPAKSGSVFRITLAVLLLGAACGVTYVVTRNHFRVDSDSYDRTAKFEVPHAYQATLDFHIPYINFTEPLAVHVDNAKKSMHLSYFSGADTYIYTPNASFTIVPVFDKETCMQADGSAPVDVFPNMDYFKLKDGATENVATRAYPGGVDCDVWEFEYHNRTTSNGGEGHADLPNADGYVGTYMFYRSKADGAPVAFRARYGHNVVLGGSHYDSYQLDYVQIVEMDAVDDFMFQAPQGMMCYENNVPTGPTRLSTRDGDVTRSHAAHDLEMLFPRGEARRAGLYGAYQQRFGKTPSGDAAEDRLRAGLFHNNVRLINTHNRANKGFTLNVNHMADWTESERAALRGYTHSGNTPAVCEQYVPANITEAAEIDWRGKSLGGKQKDPGFVNPAADQGTCGSCWSFGAVSAAEAAHYKKHGELIHLSQQNLLDCTWDMGNLACGGGEDFLGYEWLLNHNDGQWAEDASYGGYLNQDGFCHFARDVNMTENPWTHKQVEAGTTLDKCYMVTRNTSSDAEHVDNLRNALNFHVLSVAIDATRPTFYFYEQGYFYDDQCSSTELDHQVTAVGYTNYKGESYTIIRNSWSEHWGMNGFVYMSQKDNNCGVGTMPTFVTVQ